MVQGLFKVPGSLTVDLWSSTVTWTLVDRVSLRGGLLVEVPVSWYRLRFKINEVTSGPGLNGPISPDV